jgi:AraC-like DNA-binding protein
MPTPITYAQVSDFYRSLGLVSTQAADITINDLAGLHGPGPVKTPPFRTNYFTFLFITGGGGRYAVDHHEFELVPPVFYFTSPGQLKSFEITQPWEGFMLTVSYDFLRAHGRGEPDQEFPFLLAAATPPLHLEPAMQERIAGLCQLMAREYAGASPLKDAILGNLLGSFLLYVKELLQDPRLHISARNRPEAIVAQFYRVLGEQFRRKAGGQPLIKAQQLADQLHLHPKHIGATVKQQTGRTVGQWVTERRLTEACTLLHRTELAVADVGYQLGFQEPTNFTKYFKKHTGHTPTQYRQGLSAT